jgi:hypothetical protein
VRVWRGGIAGQYGGTLDNTTTEAIWSIGAPYNLDSAPATGFWNLYGMSYSYDWYGWLSWFYHQIGFHDNGVRNAAISLSNWNAYFAWNMWLGVASAWYKLDVNGNMATTIMYDKDNAGYYVDPNGSSYTNYFWRNYGYNWTEYDWNNTAFYVDPNNTSIFNALQSSITYDRDNTGYYVDPNNVSVFQDIRPSIIYDRDNTGYYADLNGTTRTNLEIPNVLQPYGVGGDSWTSAQYYGIYQESWAWANPYPDLNIAWHTGIKIWAYFWYGGTRFYNNAPTTWTEIFSVWNGDNNLRVLGDIRDMSSWNVIRDAGGGWIRTYGASGWYNGTYGWGWNMTDTTWLRSYWDKSIYTWANAWIAGSVKTTCVWNCF